MRNQAGRNQPITHCDVLLMKSSHGGTRDGAGRKKMDDTEKRQTIQVRLPPDLIERLEKFDRQKGRIVEQALRAFWEK